MCVRGNTHIHIYIHIYTQKINPPCGVLDEHEELHHEVHAEPAKEGEGRHEPPHLFRVVVGGLIDHGLDGEGGCAVPRIDRWGEPLQN